MRFQDFDMGSVAELPGFEASKREDVPNDATPELIGNLRYSRRPTKRELFDSLRVANATDHIGSLPRRGHTLHCITRGNYSMFDIVPTTLSLIKPAVISELYISTLSFSVKNANDLFEMMDAGGVKLARVICGAYFRANSASIFKHMADGLHARKQKIIGMRNHAKIILMRTTAGHSLTIESSANLRSCRNIEQFCITNDAGLFNFHRTWMETLIEKGDTK